MSRTCAVAGMVILSLLGACAEEEPPRAPVPAEVTGVERTKRGVTEVEVSIFNPHSAAAEIECDLDAGRDGMSIFLTVQGESREVVTSNLHRLKRDMGPEDVTIECWRVVEE